ncbi:exodeoxyribonuclease V subunit gamma [bacterium]|nr:exodeoxyribonuclease V subunit gamma [bacterium]
MSATSVNFYERRRFALRSELAKLNEMKVLLATLLSALGKHGQMLFAQLSQRTDQFFELDPFSDACLDTNGNISTDARTSPAKLSALHALQIGINTLDPTLKPNREIAESIQIVAADTRLCEVQALACWLHRQLAQDARLRFEDIVVMAPNINAYAPLIAAQFAAQRDAFGSLTRPAIGFSVMDAKPPPHPNLARLLTLLQLPSERFDRAALLACLQIDVLQRRFGIDAAMLAQIECLLEKACFNAGFDAEDYRRSVSLSAHDNANGHVHVDPNVDHEIAAAAFEAQAINCLQPALSRLWLGALGRARG